jgi:antiviral helicase SKI2
MAEHEFARLCASWTSSHWDEIDWLDRVREIQLREALEIRRDRLVLAQSASCLTCPDFVKHVSCGNRFEMPRMLIYGL